MHGKIHTRTWSHTCLVSFKDYFEGRASRTLIESEREKVQHLCSRKTVIGEVKMLFKEVSLKVSFEGREGRAVMESERKSIPDLCIREAKATRPSFECILFAPWKCLTHLRVPGEEERAHLLSLVCQSIGCDAFAADSVPHLDVPILGAWSVQVAVGAPVNLQAHSKCSGTHMKPQSFNNDNNI